MPLFIIPKESQTQGLSFQSSSCKKIPYNKIKSIKPFKVKGDFIAYASPDSTYAVTKKLFNLAQKEILIGIYDFGADYIKELLLNAMERNVKVTLMLDLTNEEKELFDELSRFGCSTIAAPSCGNQNAKFFTNCHEKFVIIDEEWLLVQSGNYSKNSIPFNEEDGTDSDHFKKGNRDMGVAVNSKELCTFFKEILLSDIELVKNNSQKQSFSPILNKLPILVDSVPQSKPDKIFPSKRFTPQVPIKVQPVLSPDNYILEIIKLLSSAKKSILIENQYIKSLQPEVQKLLAAIVDSKKKNKNLDIRIILGKLFSTSDVPKEEANIKNLKDNYNLELSKNIRYIDTTRFVHCHNKLIVIDSQIVLISSQNWSDTAISENREAGLILYYPEIADYYTEIFESDWKTASDQIPIPKSDVISEQNVIKGNFTQVSFGDYKEV